MSRRSGKRDPNVLTVGQAAKELGLDRETLRNYVAAGQVPSDRLSGGQIRLSRETVEAIKAKMRHQG